MEPIAYRTVDINGSKTDVREGFQPDGARWWLADRKDDVAHGSMTLADPDQSKFKAYAESLKKPIEDRELFSRDHRFLNAHVAPQSEIIHCSRMDMLIALIERLRDPRPAAGTMIEVLEAAGFKASESIPALYELDLGKGAIYAWTDRGGLKAEYHGKDGMWWTNLLKVETSITTVSGEVWERFWPEDYGDVEAKAAEFLIDQYIPWVRETRIGRNTR